MNKIHEEIRRALYDAEGVVKKAARNFVDSRDTLEAHTNRSQEAGLTALGVELIASRNGWEVFVTYLQSQGFLVETRRWVVFNEQITRYDLYVEQPQG